MGHPEKQITLLRDQGLHRLIAIENRTQVNCVTSMEIAVGPSRS